MPDPVTDSIAPATSSTTPTTTGAPEIAHVESSLIDLSHEPILAWRIDGDVTLWNTGCERLYGFSRDEALGRNVHELLQTAYPLPFARILSALRERGQWSGELRHRTRDGQEVVVESRQQLVESDGVLLVLETNRDITERGRAEAVRTMLASLVESSDDAIISTDLNGIVTSWNRAAERTFGYTEEEAYGGPIGLIVPLERRKEEEDLLARISAGEIVEPIETVRRRKNGTLVPTSVSTSPIRDGLGRLIGVSMVARDITERKRAAERAAFLAEATRLLVASLDYQATLTAVAQMAVPAIADWAGVDLLARDGSIEHVATAHVDPTRIELGRRLQMRYEDPSSSYSVPAVVRTGTPFLVPLISEEMIAASAARDEERIRLVATLGLVSYMCVPLIAHGRTLGALTLATAESRRQYGDEDLAFARDVAYHLALAIDNAQAYQDAQLANRLKDEFMATLSHEMRTPLNAVLGYTRLLKLEMTAPERRPHAIAAVERNATALARIVEDVLDVSRVISGKIRLDIQSVDVAALVRSAIETITPAADAKEIRIETAMAPDAGAICGDT